jgi:hypothetical protein
MGAPVVSVILVSDYAGGQEKSWSDIRKTLDALEAQDFRGEAEWILVEHDAWRDRFQADLMAVFPRMRVVWSASAESYVMKNEGARQAKAHLVALLDADCTPQREWLRLLVAAMQAHPEAAAVSARTKYEGRTLLERHLSLLSRSYLDPGRFGPTKFLANNNSVMRRDVYLRHPLPQGGGAFSSRLQSEAILREGGMFLFEPGAVAVHDFEGWGMESDLRRNSGYGAIITRLRDKGQPYSWLAKGGVISIPVFVAGRIYDRLCDAVRCYRHYEVPWYELPITAVLALVTQAMEAGGMYAAFQGRPLASTMWR